MKFELGRVVATPGVLEHFQGIEESILPYIARHSSGDWGDLDEHDIQVNERALSNDEQLLSSYKTVGNQKIWIITERDRSVTTVLLPSEY